jgi:hypothetical protein
MHDADHVKQHNQPPRNATHMCCVLLAAVSMCSVEQCPREECGFYADRRTRSPAKLAHWISTALAVLKRSSCKLFVR